MKKLLAALVVLLSVVVPAKAQTAQCTVTYGTPYGPRWTIGQWNGCFASMQAALGYTPLNIAGGSMTGKLNTVPSTTSSAGINLGQGSAPSAPVNGDLWSTSSGLYGYFGGNIVGPFGTQPTFTYSSSTSVTINTGSVTFVVATTAQFYAGEFVQATYTGSGSDYIFGTVTSFTSSSGTLVIDAISTGGSGTYASWVIAPSGPPGPGGVSGPSSSTIGDIAGWNNTAGSLLYDGGVPISNFPTTSTSGDLASYSSSGGKFSDSGVPASNLPTSGTTSGDVATLDNTTGKIVDSGVQISTLTDLQDHVQVFGSSGNFTTPSNTTSTDLFKFTVTGGGGNGANGGGSSNDAGGGGAGGTFIAWITGLSASENISVAVGGAGEGSAITVGSTTLTAPPGGSGSGASPGLGGIPTNSNSTGITVINLGGGDGGNANGLAAGGFGGNSYWGGGGTNGYNGNGQGGHAPGAGGGGGDGSGGAGANGIVVVEWSS